MKITTPVVVCGTAIVLALIGGVIFMSQGSTDNVKFIIANGMLGTIGTLIAALFLGKKVEQAAVKADVAAKSVDDMHEDLKNGLIGTKVRETLNEMAHDPNNLTVTVDNVEDDTPEAH